MKTGSENKSADGQRPQIPSEWKKEEIVGLSAAESAGGKIAHFGKMFFWIFLGLLSVFVAFGIYVLSQYYAARDVSFTASAPDAVYASTPFKTSLSLTNNTAKLISNVQLSSSFSERITLSGGDNNYSENFDPLEAGGALETDLSLFVEDNENSVKRIDFSASYTLNGFLKFIKFNKKAFIQITVRERGAKLDLFAPEKVLNGDPLELKLNYANVSENDFSDFQIVFTHPENFSVKSAIPKPTAGYVWKIGKLAKGQSGAITINGSIASAVNSFVKITVSAKNGEEIINEKETAINVVPSPLSMEIILTEKISAVPGEELFYKIKYKNNSDIAMNDVFIKIKPAGNMFDLSSIRGGSLNSLDNTVFWNATVAPELRQLPPNSEGDIDFNVKIKPDYPVKKAADKNFFVKISGEISSPTVPYYVVAEQSSGKAELTTKIAGTINFKPKMLYSDPSFGSFAKGPLPLRANRSTVLTVHWTISTYAADFKNIEARTLLQPGSKWLGKVKSNISAIPVYNEKSQSIIWKIDKLAANKGALGTPAEAIFQIEVTPNITQAGQSIPIIGEMTFVAEDEFSGLKINAKNPELRSDSLPEAANPEYGVVQL